MKWVKLKVPLFHFILATNGVVLATEKKQKSVLYDESSIHKIEMITKNVGMTYSGMGPDYRFVSHWVIVIFRYNTVMSSQERSGSVVECLTLDREAECSSLTGVFALCP